MTVYLMRSYGTLMDQRMAGQYLAEFDPEALGGIGVCRWTTDPAKAIWFKRAMDGFEMWRTISATHPLRDDGKPNRPLSAHSIEMVPYGG